MDIASLLPSGRNAIQSYGEGGFTVAGERYTGSVLVLPERVVPWPIHQLDKLSRSYFVKAFADNPGVDILLLGCGLGPTSDPRHIGRKLTGLGVSVEVMDTGAACRTFNVLLAEERRPAAALMAV